MASFNRVMLLGNLTRDPQMKYLPNQTPVTEFGIACNRKFKSATGEQREEVTFVDCSAFGKQAEIINQYCSKGKPLFIEGRLKYDTWEDKNGGGKRSKLHVVIENFQLLGGRDSGGGAGGQDGSGPQEEGGYTSRPSPAPRAARAPASGGGGQAPPLSEEQHYKDDDIPF